jgi:quercetin dioxygenase-like cupin family protein
MRIDPLRTISCVAVALPLGLGCASRAAAPVSSAEQTTTAEPPFRPLTLPAPDLDGPEREVTVVLDAAHLKIVAIALRRGAVLPEHTAPVPVVIQAAAGAGTAVLGDQRVRLDATHAVTLAPNVPHAVEPDAGSDMTLLVFHLRGGS